MYYYLEKIVIRFSSEGFMHGSLINFFVCLFFASLTSFIDYFIRPHPKSRHSLFLARWFCYQVIKQNMNIQLLSSPHHTLPATDG